MNTHKSKINKESFNKQGEHAGVSESQLQININYKTSTRRKTKDLNTQGVMRKLIKQQINKISN